MALWSYQSSESGSSWESPTLQDFRLPSVLLASLSLAFKKQGALHRASPTCCPPLLLIHPHSDTWVSGAHEGSSQTFRTSPLLCPLASVEFLLKATRTSDIGPKSDSPAGGPRQSGLAPETHCLPPASPRPQHPGVSGLLALSKAGAEDSSQVRASCLSPSYLQAGGGKGHQGCHLRWCGTPSPGPEGSCSGSWGPA